MLCAMWEACGGSFWGGPQHLGSFSIRDRGRPLDRHRSRKTGCESRPPRRFIRNERNRYLFCGEPVGALQCPGRHDPGRRVQPPKHMRALVRAELHSDKRTSRHSMTMKHASTRPPSSDASSFIRPPKEWCKRPRMRG